MPSISPRPRPSIDATEIPAAPGTPPLVPETIPDFEDGDNLSHRSPTS